jgi:hypothetical protein
MRGVAAVVRRISGSSTVVAAKDQVSADLGGEAAILNLKNGAYYGLNSVGARVWELAQTPKTVGELRDAILDEYDVEPERCERDLLALLQELETEGLIEVVDAKAP